MTIKTKGTKEWSDVSLNILTGCPHSCTYCYARKMDHRFNRDPEGCKLKEKMPRLPRNKRVMFPSAHDLAPEFLGEFAETIIKLIDRNNQVLVVTKAPDTVIQSLLEDYLFDLGSDNEIDQITRDNLEVRVSITHTRPFIGEMYEKGAGTYHQRLNALEILRAYNIKTSVSIEPLLGTPEDLDEIITSCRNRGVYQIWIGCLSFIPKEMKEHTWYSQENLNRIYEKYNKFSSDIVFKDTFLNRWNPNLTVKKMKKGESDPSQKTMGVSN